MLLVAGTSEIAPVRTTPLLLLPSLLLTPASLLLLLLLAAVACCAVLGPSPSLPAKLPLAAVLG
jgi:hypothetical protein